MQEYDDLIKALRWDALNCTRVVPRNIEEDCRGAADAIEELISNNNALVIALGEAQRKIK